MISFLEKNRRFITPCLCIVSLFLIIFHFLDTPKVWVDEGVFTETAKNLAFHGTLGLQTSVGTFFPMNNVLLSTGYPVIFPIALSFYLFGLGLLQARVVMLVYMILFVGIAYLFVEKRYGYIPAVLSVLSILSFSPFYGNGRPVQGEIPGLFFLVSGAYSLLVYEYGGFTSKKWAHVTGLSFGLAMATKPLFLAVLGISLIFGFILWFRKIGCRVTHVYFLGGISIPLIVWFFVHFQRIGNVIQSVRTFMYLSGNHGGQSVSTFQTVVHNALRFITEATPIIFCVLVVSVCLAYLCRLYQKRSVMLTESVLGCFIFFNWLLYLKGTGWYRYFFPAHMLVYLFFPAAVLYLVRGVSSVWVKKIGEGLVLLLIAFQFYHLIFLSDTSFIVRRTRNQELAAALGSIDSQHSVLFYNSIEAAVFLKHFNYTQYLAMDDFLVAGDARLLSSTDADVILTDRSQGDNVALSCYTESRLSQYYFLQKKTSCK